MDGTIQHWWQDRFMLFLVAAIGMHALVVFGITFGIDLTSAPRLSDTLDIVLVKWRTEEDPEDADFLAQDSQQGGGESIEKERPSQPVSGELPLPEQGEDEIQSTPQLPTPHLPEQEVITVEAEQAETEKVTELEQPDPELPSSARLMRQSMDMASLQPEMSRQRQWQSKLPRRERVSANTKKYEYAAYMSAWVAKVERVGNLNYPNELRQKGLHGDLILSVGIHQNGSIESIEVMRSSGISEIDEAAQNIVQMAGPYAPLPDNIAEHVDILHIVRTWRFESSFGAD